MISLIYITAFLGIVLSLILASFAFLALIRGASSRRRFTMNLPDWPGCPRGWYGKNGRIHVDEKSLQDTGIGKVQLEGMITSGPPEPDIFAPQVVDKDPIPYHIIFFSGMHRGEEGWWFSAIPKKN